MQVLTPPPVYNYKNIRDLQLDIYRALMMVYIPCVIHVMYWLGKVGEPFRSIALFEMPVIFYISGATMYVTNTDRGFLSSVSNRVKRILFPYYFYILISLLFVLLFSLYFPSLSEISLRSMIKILLAQDHSLPVPYMSHLWFIIPYLIVSCSFPIQKKWANSVNRWIYMVILIAFLFIIQHAWNSSQSIIYKVIREALFYNFFFIAGYLFYKRISLKQLITVTILSGMIAAILIYHECAFTGEFTMQSHKFPPDLLFIFFGTFCICFLSLTFGNFKLPQNRILMHWNKYGYTIYLWQNISFFIYTIIYSHTFLNKISNHPIVDFFMASAGIFVISTATSLLIAPIESKVMKYISSIHFKNLFSFLGKVLRI